MNGEIAQVAVSANATRLSEAEQLLPFRHYQKAFT
jgi:hypothetical protein